MFKAVAMPPVCIWGTLLDSKLTIVRNKIQANVNQGSHVVAKSLYESKEKLISKIKKEKQTESNVQQENVQETTSNVEPEVNIQENNVFVGPDFSPIQDVVVEETSYGPDFSNCQNGVIYDIDPTVPMPEAIVEEVVESELNQEQTKQEPLYEVTPEDIDYILKNMQGGAK